MLFSILLSYYLANENQGKEYVLLTVLSVIAISLLSIFGFPLEPWIYWYSIILFSSLSFPFFVTSEYQHNDPWDIASYNVDFFTLKTVSIPPQTLIIYGFLLFALINSIGAILGYWINKKLSVRSIKQAETFEFFSKNTTLFWIGCYVILLATIILSPGPLNYIVQNILYLWRFWFWIPPLAATAIYAWHKRREAQCPSSNNHLV
jgi:hypothetical protein